MTRRRYLLSARRALEPSGSASPRRGASMACRSASSPARRWRTSRPALASPTPAWWRTGTCASPATV